MFLLYHRIGSKAWAPTVRTACLLCFTSQSTALYTKISNMKGKWLSLGRCVVYVIVVVWTAVVLRLLFTDRGTLQAASADSSESSSSTRARAAIPPLKKISVWEYENVVVSDPRYHHPKTSSQQQSLRVDLALPPLVIRDTTSVDTRHVQATRVEDYTVDLSTRYDIMPVTGLKVPKFWKPAPSTAIRDIGSKVDGLETIFVMIASYRDFQCRETIASLFSRADHPERIFVGAADQIVDEDVGCVTLPRPCEEDPEQMLCKYKDQITVYKMDAKLATGPVTARHIGDRLYQGQYFTMQLDAHCEFALHWDSNIIDQWRQTGNEMAVLSSYLSDVQGSIDKNGDSTRHTRPIMCNSAFEGAMPARYLRHGSQPEDVPAIRDMPQLEPFWAAGFSFSRGHFIVQVPYDGYQPMVFQGEEIGIGIRGFTHGYDFYAPRDSVVFHEYAVKSTRRKKVHMYWENSNRHVGEAKKSLARGMSIVKMAPDIADREWDHSEMDRYGVGTERSVDLFYKLFLIDTRLRTSVQLCPFVRPGHMHKEFQKYLRSDGMGIDYSHLRDFDTSAYLDNVLEAQRPGVEAQLRNAMDNRNKGSLEFLLTNAVTVRIDKKNPTLFQEAKSVLSLLQSS